MTAPSLEGAPVAVIGLGRMGGLMGANLAAAGRPVRGFDVVAPLVEAAARAGVQACVSAEEAARGAACVITMLPSGADVLACYERPEGLLAVVSPGTLVIDCSTIDLEDAMRLHAIGAAAGLAVADAPVSGGVEGARRGTLTFMVGADQATFDAAGPFLDPMAAHIVHCGGPGSGQVAKLCNNMILGASMLAVSEAFVLAEALGLSRQTLFDVASTSSARCFALTDNCPVAGPVPTSPANDGYRPGFKAELMLKDLAIAQRAASRAGADLPVGRLALDVYAAYVEERGGEADFSAIVEWVRERPGDGV